jgi:hypothetical protein
VLILGIALAIWLAIGFGFGLPRARQRYLEEIAKYPVHYRESPGAVKREAMIDAGITLTRWMLLGLLSALAFIVWRVWEMHLADTRRRGR